MTPLYLFKALCGLADALQAECIEGDVSPHKLALEAIVQRLDVLIDAVVDEGIHEAGTPADPHECRWTGTRS